MLDTFAIRLGRMKSRIFTWAEEVDQYKKNHPVRLVLVTLTYAKVDDYRPGHLGNYLKNIKTKLGKNLLAFAWVAELQQRLAVHYHVVLVVKPGTKIPKPDKGGYWVHGMSKIETARTAYYLATYTGKKYQKDLSKYPKSCRLYAVSIRSSMREKTSVGSSGGQIGHKKVSVRTAEGLPVWEFKGAGVTEGYVSMMAGDG